MQARVCTHARTIQRDVGSQNKSVSQISSVLTSAARSKHRHLCAAFKALLISHFGSLYLYGDAARRLLMRLLYYLPSGHRTESHIPHLSLPVSLCVFSHKCPLPRLCYSFTLLPPILPSLWHSCLLLFPPPCHCCSVSFAPFPFLCAESICSSLVSLSSPAHLFLSLSLSLALSPPPPPLWLCLPLFHPPLFS